MRKVKASLWRGRLDSSMHPVAQRFLSSFDEDAALVDIDIDVGEAHALALDRAGIFRTGEVGRVLRAFERARVAVRRALARGTGASTGVFHDIHPMVEKMIMDRCGEETGGRVHLGKSRNDQVATDICIYARRRVLAVLAEVAALENALLDACRRCGSELFPASTHGRVAQSTTVGHYLLANVEALGRDADRLLEARVRLLKSPLGAAAVAGTSVPVNRNYTARLLGFSGVWLNALDATSSRDHVLELLSGLAILQSTLSRIAADLIFLCGDAGGVFSYPDEMADTSSAMPQKKNPDPLELVRARAGTLSGLMSGAFAMVHGLQSGYSRDLQELKPALWRSFDYACESTTVVRLVVERLSVHGRATEALQRGYAAALDLAEILCLRKNMSFRRAHYAVGQLVQRLVCEKRTFEQVGADEACRILSLSSGRPVRFSSAEWRDAVDLRRGAARRKGGGPGSVPELLSAAVSTHRRLDRAVKSLEFAEARAQRVLQREVARRSRASALGSRRGTRRSR